MGSTSSRPDVVTSYRPNFNPSGCRASRLPRENYPTGNRPNYNPSRPSRAPPKSYAKPKEKSKTKTKMKTKTEDSRTLCASDLWALQAPSKTKLKTKTEKKAKTKGSRTLYASDLWPLQAPSNDATAGGCSVGDGGGPTGGSSWGSGDGARGRHGSGRDLEPLGQRRERRSLERDDVRSEAAPVRGEPAETLEIWHEDAGPAIVSPRVIEHPPAYHEWHEDSSA